MLGFPLLWRHFFEVRLLKGDLERAPYSVVDAALDRVCWNTTASKVVEDER